MRNWGTLITGFYIVVIAALSPALVVIVLNIFDPHQVLETRPWLRDLEYVYGGDGNWHFVAFVAGWATLLAGGPLVLVRVKVDPTRMKLRPRRHIWVSAAAVGLALTMLVGAAITNVLYAIPEPTLRVIREAAGGEDVFGLLIIAFCLGWWLVWALVLWRMGERLLDPATRVYRWLIKGSVLELLVAIPSHIIVRQRNECTAPEVTSFGVATGIALLLMSLGPGALFLYRARMRRLSQPPTLDRVRS